MAPIRFEVVRSKIDPPYRQVHDELSAAYYSRGVWTRGATTVDFGKLSRAEAKRLFDAYHAALWAHHAVDLDAENLKLPAKDRIDPVKYQDDLAQALADIDAIKAAGVDFPNAGSIVSAQKAVGL